MKSGLIHLLLSLSHATVNGWCVHPLKLGRRPELLALGASNDRHSNAASTEAIKKAIDATKKYGATSQKARMAWEVVEKIEQSNQSESNQSASGESEKELDVATHGYGRETTEKQTYITGEATYDIMESNMRDVKSLLDEEMAKMNSLKNIVLEAKKQRNTHEMKSVEAIAAYREATREHGIHSYQTTLAWKALEASVSDCDVAP